MRSAADALTRSRRDLAEARHLAAGGFQAGAVSRAYFAGFHAAEACPIALGESRSKHSGVIAAFNQLLVRSGGIEPGTGRVLQALFDRRNEADYAVTDAPPARADAAIGDAERLIAAVEVWLPKRDRP